MARCSSAAIALSERVTSGGQKELNDYLGSDAPAWVWEPASQAMPRLPARIVCLTEEPTEVLYALGEQHRIVGISGYTVRPPQARQEKPRVSAFLSARIDQILALEPDLVLGFSDLQADIASTLIRAGVPVTYREAVGNIHGFVTLRKAIPSSVGDVAGYLAAVKAAILEAEGARVMAQALPTPAAFD